MTPKWARPKQPRKFRRGEPIDNIGDLAFHLQADREGYVYLFGQRPMHPLFVRQQKLDVLLDAINAKRIHYAVVTDEWQRWAADQEEMRRVG